MHSFIDYQGHRIAYTVTYRKRKTIGISVTVEDGVQVSSPRWISQTQLQDVLRKKAPWILKKIARMQEIADSRIEHSYSDGESYLFLGNTYQLKVSALPGLKHPTVMPEGEILAVHLPSDTAPNQRSNIVRAALLDWYRLRLEDIVSARVKFFSDLMQLYPKKVLIKEHKRIWGSCTGKNTININWKIVMAPLPIIDYLLVHELAHIKQKNHSAGFWALVASVLPDYKVKSGWLKENGYKLRIS